ncbi:MAG: DUF4340 domain-containing protein [Spirochaetota bacterium]
MTYKSRVILLTAAAVLLLSTYFLGTLFNPRKDITLSAKPLLPGLSPEDIGSVEFSNADYSLQRGAESEQWNILIEGESFPADQVQVQSFIESVAQLSYYSLASKDKDTWTDFSIADGQGDRVTIFTDSAKEQEISLVFGAKVQGSSRQYTRISNSENTYVADDLSAYLDRESGYWADLNLFPADMNIQAVISIEYRDYRIERAEAAQGQAQWILSQGSSGDGQPIDETDTVDRFLRSYIELSGEDFATASERDNSGLSSPREIIRIETSNGNEYELRIGSQSTQDRIFASAGHSEYTYLVSEWRVNTVLNPLNELVD